LGWLDASPYFACSSRFCCQSALFSSANLFWHPAPLSATATTSIPFLTTPMRRLLSMEMCLRGKC
jgi:hypothetical protein